MLSFLLVISPVSVAYSSLMGDNETEQTSHCKQSSQQQSKKSCCQNDQCNDNQCMSMQCSSFVQQAMSAGTQHYALQISKSFIAEHLFYGPEKGPPNTLLRPPIEILQAL